MDRAPFSAFLLLLIGVVLLAQFVTGNIWSFLDGLLGTNTAAAPASASSGTKAGASPATFAGNSRLG